MISRVIMIALMAVAVTATSVPNSAGCQAKTGVCGLVSQCTGTGALVYKGLCAGDSTIACCVRSHSAPANIPRPPTTGPVSNPSVNQINTWADASVCSKRNWPGRGTAPKAYIRGLAQSFAKAVCNPTRPDVVFVGNANLGSNDALAHYGATLRSKLGAPVAGLNVVRQLYTLLAGLGMRESSGSYCTGRDMSASFSKSSTAEAGLFQTSWGANTRSPQMAALFNKYKASKAGCLYGTYSAGVKCSASNLKNWGQTSEPGYQWQALTKSCPSFATEYAAVLLRVNGGAKGEWGPLRTRVVEVVPECFSLFGQVQQYVASNPSVCSQLNV